MYICFYIITDFVFIFQLVPCKSYHFNNLLTEAGVMHEAGYVDYLEHLVPLLKLDINILSILHYLGSPLGFSTLIFDLMRNLYIYIACIYIQSIHIKKQQIKRTTMNKNQETQPRINDEKNTLINKAG